MGPTQESVGGQLRVARRRKKVPVSTPSPCQPLPHGYQAWQGLTSQALSLVVRGETVFTLTLTVSGSVEQRAIGYCLMSDLTPHLVDCALSVGRTLGYKSGDSST
jgi:hypothetical protein